MHKLHLTLAACVTALVLAACGSDAPDDNGDNGDNDPTTYTLTLTASSNGTVASSPTGTSFDAGTDVTLTATPASGYKVAAWAGTNDDVSTATVNHVTMSANKIVNVTFTPVVVAPTQKVLTLVLDQDNTPGAWGVTATPTGTTYHANSQTISYDVGTVVTLTAVDAPAWPFLGWSGDIGAADADSCSIQVTMDVDRTIHAAIPLDNATPSLCD